MSPRTPRRPPLAVALVGDEVIRQQARLTEALGGAIRCIPVPDDMPPDARASAVAHADAAVATRFDLPLRHSAALRLLQLTSAGYEHIALDQLPAGTTLCKVSGHGPAIAEYVLTCMLMSCLRWPAVEASFRAGSWQYRGLSHRPLRRELRSHVVGILGLGHIGLSVAATCRALGVRTLGCARRAPAPGTVDAYRPWTALEDFLGEADFIVLCLAYSDALTGLMDQRRLARMKPTGVLINVARGALVDEQALYDALRSRRIAGAALDAWWSYPSVEAPGRRGSRLPFHTLPNVFMTPHVSAWSEQAFAARWATIAENLRRLANGQALIEVVRAGSSKDAAR